jgi:hypothetical protein
LCGGVVQSPRIPARPASVGGRQSRGSSAPYLFLRGAVRCGRGRTAHAGTPRQRPRVKRPTAGLTGPHDSREPIRETAANRPHSYESDDPPLVVVQAIAEIEPNATCWRPQVPEVHMRSALKWRGQ